MGPLVMGVGNVTPDSFSDGGRFSAADRAVAHGRWLAAAGAAARAHRTGCREVWVDPGIGFGKTAHHNLALLAALPELVEAGHPVVVGASRKGFLGALTGGAPVADRLEASVAVAAWAFSCGVHVVRAHDVPETVQALRLATVEAGPEPHRAGGAAA